MVDKHGALENFFARYLGRWSDLAFGIGTISFGYIVGALSFGIYRPVPWRWDSPLAAMCFVLATFCAGIAGMAVVATRAHDRELATAQRKISWTRKYASSLLARALKASADAGTNADKAKSRDSDVVQDAVVMGSYTVGVNDPTDRSGVPDRQTGVGHSTGNDVPTGGTGDVFLISPTGDRFLVGSKLFAPKNTGGDTITEFTVTPGHHFVIDASIYSNAEVSALEKLVADVNLDVISDVETKAVLTAALQKLAELRKSS